MGSLRSMVLVRDYTERFILLPPPLLLVHFLSVLTISVGFVFFQLKVTFLIPLKVVAIHDKPLTYYIFHLQVTSKKLRNLLKRSMAIFLKLRLS